jgi:hypothetical protein
MDPKLFDVVKNYGVGSDADVIILTEFVFISSFGRSNFENRHSIILFINGTPHMYTIYGYPYDKFIKLSPIYGHDSQQFYFGLEYGYVTISATFEVVYYPNENLYHCDGQLITSNGYYINNTLVPTPEDCVFIGYSNSVITFFNTKTLQHIHQNTQAVDTNTRYFTYNKDSTLVIQSTTHTDTDAHSVIDIGVCGKYSIYPTWVTHNGKTLYDCKEKLQHDPRMFSVYVGGVTPMFIFSFHENIMVCHDIGRNYLRVMTGFKLITVVSDYIITQLGIYNSNFQDIGDMQFDFAGAKYINHCFTAGRYFLKYNNKKNYYIELGKTKGCFKPLADAPIKLDI